MKEKAVLFPIPGHILHITIESSRDYQLRLEAEAAALAGMDSPQARPWRRSGWNRRRMCGGCLSITLPFRLLAYFIC